MTTTTHEISDIFNNYGYLIEESTNKMLVSPSEDKMYFALVRPLDKGDKHVAILVGLNPIQMK